MPITPQKGINNTINHPDNPSLTPFLKSLSSSSLSSPSTDSDDFSFDQPQLNDKKINSAISQRKSFIKNIDDLKTLNLNQRDQLYINFYDLYLKLLDLDDETRSFLQRINQKKEATDSQENEEDENIEQKELEKTNQESIDSNLFPIMELSKKIDEISKNKLTSEFREIFRDLINLEENEATKIKEETLKDVQKYLSATLDAFYEIISENEELELENGTLKIENKDQKVELENLISELKTIKKSEDDTHSLTVKLNDASIKIDNLKELNEILKTSYEEEEERLKSKILELNNQLKQKQQEQTENLERLRKEYELSNQLSKTQEHYEYENKIKIEKEKFDKKVETLKQKLNETEEEKKFYKETADNLLTINEELELKLKNQSTLYKNRIESSESKITQLKKEKTELQTELVKKEETIQNLSKKEWKTLKESKGNKPITLQNLDDEKMRNKSNSTPKKDVTEELQKIFDDTCEEIDKEIDETKTQTLLCKDEPNNSIDEEKEIKKEEDDDEKKLSDKTYIETYLFTEEKFKQILEIEHQKIKNLDKELENKTKELEGLKKALADNTKELGDSSQSRGRSSSVQESPFTINDQTKKKLEDDLLKLKQEKLKLENEKNDAITKLAQKNQDNALFLNRLSLAENEKKLAEEDLEKTQEELKKGRGKILFAKFKETLAEENLKKTQEKLKTKEDEIGKLKEFYQDLHTTQKNNHKTELETQKKELETQQKDLVKRFLGLELSLRINKAEKDRYLKEKTDAEAKEKDALNKQKIAEAEKQAALNEVTKLKNQKNNIVYVDRIVEKNNFIENSEIEKVRGELYNKLSENKSLTKELEALKKENKELQSFKPDYNKAAQILFGKKDEKAQKIEIDYYRNHRARIHGSNEDIKDLSEASDEEIIKEIIKDQEKALVKSVKKLIIKLRNDDELSIAEIATIKAFDKENGKNPIIESIKDHASLFDIPSDVINENKHLKTASNQENHSLLKPSTSTKTLQSSQLVGSNFRTRH